MSEVPVSNLDDMLAAMGPVLDRDPYRFLLQTQSENWMGHLGKVLATIEEDEGLSMVVRAKKYEEGTLFAKITLQVHSSLEGVGLTAAVATALADKGIACNVIAAFHHDHLFVPWHRREEALQTLKDLSENARRKV